MIFNYIKIAFRNLTRNKVYSLINVLGLSLGIGCCLLLSLYIQDELSYDKHQKGLDNLYTIVTNMGEFVNATTSPPVALTMRDEIPEIESAVRIINPPGVSLNLIKYEDKLFYETNGFIADSSLFEVLTYDLIKGNAKKALVDANSVVINESLSKKIFGNDQPLDKIISISQGGVEINFKVTGVFREIGKSHLEANFFTSMTSEGFATLIRTEPGFYDEWGGQNFIPAYIKLVSGADKDVVTKKINEVFQKYGAKDMKEMGREKSFSLMPVRDIYLRSQLEENPRIVYLYVIASIAVFILLIACINFMNLSTAKATKRAAEIGIRKVMGAVRSSLVRQILGEAMVIVLISILISIVLVQLALPMFNGLTGKTISFDTENIAFFLLALVGIAIVTGIVAGSYPAFYLSSFQPAEVLKGKFKMSNSSGWLRQSLVVFQFMIAITLVCGMIVISRQLTFMQNKDLGFDSHTKIVLPLRTENARRSYDGLQRELQMESAIKNVTGTQYVPGASVWNDQFFYPDGGKKETAIDNYRVVVDFGYMRLMGIKLLAGQDFTGNRQLESDHRFIINRTSAEKFGFTPEGAVGQHIYAEGNGKKYSYEIIGVMEDYHQQNLKEVIRPLMFQLADSTDYFSFVVADVSTENFKEAVSSIGKIWNEQVSDTPFEYSFLDESLQKQYDEDRKVSNIISSFTIIAMLISCLGLYGLSSYMAERRFKEIGVRKIMGASVKQIVGMMSKEFIKLVLVAFIISVPLAWYGMTAWLSGFAYKTDIDFFIFVYAGTAALLVALLTVSFESLKAAIANPVESLRNE